MPEPEFELGERVILKDSGKRKATLLAGEVVEINYTLAHRTAVHAQVKYVVELELGLKMQCEAGDLYRDRRQQP
mgnify:CR=1 FL=1